MQEDCGAVTPRIAQRVRSAPDHGYGRCFGLDRLDCAVRTRSLVSGVTTAARRQAALDTKLQSEAWLSKRSKPPCAPQRVSRLAALCRFAPKKELTIRQSSVARLVVRIERHLPFKHGAGNIEQAISNATQRPSMPITPAPQLGVALAADRIMLSGDTRPTIDRILQPFIAGISPDHDVLLAAAASDRGDTLQSPQGMVISPP